MIPVLRDYQIEDIEELRRRFRAGAHSVLYQAPTASGKTVFFAEIVRSAEAKGNPVWVVVHRQELVDQTSRALTALSVPHEIVAAGRFHAGNGAVSVCSVQTLVRRLDKMGDVKLMVLDEAHHSVAGTWDKVISSRPDALLLGVTATPERLDGRGLGREYGGHFDVLIEGPTVEALTAQGYLAPARVYIPPQVADLAGLKTRAGDYAAGDAALRMDRPTVTGDAIEHYERICPGASAIVFCTRIQHAENVAAAFRKKGWRAESIDGTLPDAARRHRIRALGTGHLQILTSCEIVSEGTDIPIVAAAILLRPTQSLGMHLQQIGRVLRPAPDKTHATILDHVGNSVRHGFPDDPRDWSLGGRPKGRADDRAPPIRVCPQCFAAFRPAPVCLYCGFEYPIQEREVDQVQGDLVEAGDQERNFIRYQRNQTRSQVGRAIDREALERIAEERGYKTGWVDYVLNARAKKKGLPLRQGIYPAIDPSGTIKEIKGEPADAPVSVYAGIPE
ncbi:hypothetical protein LCGC14_1159450 [marine sediment metagenome]|uniref:Helicase ATP-binding domain-containing protein n=1 Tax=marine sediment metagenome TaxID=412755 RepID=A0A0F9LT42_9ZZZZ